MCRDGTGVPSNQRGLSGNHGGDTLSEIQAGLQDLGQAVEQALPSYWERANEWRQGVGMLPVFTSPDGKTKVTLWDSFLAFNFRPEVGSPEGGLRIAYTR